MKNLIKLQLRNMFKSKLFYICLGITALMNILVFVLEFFYPDERVLLMPKIVGIFSSGLDMILIIFVSLFSSEDFNENTAKNIIGRGYSRKDLLLSKYIVSIIGVFAINFIMVLLMILLYIWYGIDYEKSMLLVIFVSLFMIIAETILYSSISFILEKHSSSILACLFAPNIVSFILSIIGKRINFDLSKYWISNLSDIYISNPNIKNIFISIIGYLIYIVIIILVTIKLSKNKEIK
jgi:ABC-type transport system involved in multi-copper enzyme maturation permease subunit